MRDDQFDRRTLLAATTALGAAALMPQPVAAQATVSASGAALPARGEFVIRGAHVLSMDAAIGLLRKVQSAYIATMSSSVSTPL